MALAEAAAAPGDRVWATAAQVEACASVAVLLAQAAFGPAPARPAAAWAEALAAACTALVRRPAGA